MIVCHCGVVSDREIRSAIACGATSECGIAAACGAGMRCGGCLPAVREMLSERGLPVDHLLDAPAIRAAVSDPAAAPLSAAAG